MIGNSCFASSLVIILLFFLPTVTEKMKIYKFLFLKFIKFF